MERIYSIDTDKTGATTIVTLSNITLTLTPESSAQLADHMINSLPVKITLKPNGRYWTAVADLTA